MICFVLDGEQPFVLCWEWFVSFELSSVRIQSCSWVPFASFQYLQGLHWCPSCSWCWWFVSSLSLLVLSGSCRCYWSFKRTSYLFSLIFFFFCFAVLSFFDLLLSGLFPYFCFLCGVFPSFFRFLCWLNSWLEPFPLS